MRWTPALVLLLLAPAALAQPCDPSQSAGACPDTTDWRRYIPLGVGNIWQYREAFAGEPVRHWSWTITGEAEVGTQTYVTLERCDETDDGGATCADPVFLRYDDANDLIVRRDGDGETWWSELPCGLEADFNSEYVCTGPGTEGTTFEVPFGRYDGFVNVPPDTVSGDTQKQFDWLFARGWEMFAGLGVTKFFYELQGEPTQLAYAYVDGEQVGTPAFASCDPADVGDIACPDTTDWRRYYPLAVGNQWQYRYEGFCDGGVPCRTGQEVVEVEVVDDKSYYLIRSCQERVSGEITCFEPRWVRYDSMARTVVTEDSDGTLYDYVGSCNLDFPFDFQGEAHCVAENVFDGFYWGTSGGYDGIFDLGVGPTVEGSEKTIGSIGGGGTYFAGIGPIRFEGDGDKFLTRLAYARVDGVEYGTPVFAFPTAEEPGAAQPATTAFTEVFPNPARGTVQAQYALGAPQAVTLELIDLLGRRIRSTELGRQAAGAHDVQIDTGGLRVGVYVLRLRGDAGANAMRRMVVLR